MYITTMVYIATKYSVKVLTCPFCVSPSWTAKQEPNFYLHLQTKHGITDFAECYIEHELKGVRPVCVCASCQNDGALTKWAGWKRGFPSNVLRGHNIRLPDAPIRDPEIYLKAAVSREESRLAGDWIHPNTGKTKETCPILAVAAEKKSKTLLEGYKSGRLVSPRAGQTAETYEPIAKGAATVKKKRESGEFPFWSEGHTKETHPSVAQAAEGISRARQEHDWFRLTSEEVLARVSQQSVFDMVTSSHDYETKYQHLEFKCRKAGHTQFKTIKMLKDCPICWECDPSSMGQREIRDFVVSLGVDVEYDTRSIIAPKELDIFVPACSFAIEYNGLYHHSEKLQPDKNFHSKKTKMCSDKSIDLMHVFSDEWKNKRPIVESMIRNRLGKSSRRIFARQCSLRELTLQERENHFNKTHLDADSRSKASWGLFFENDIVAAISVRTPQEERYRGMLEVCRFSCSLNTSVVGGLGKLMKKVIEYAGQLDCHAILSYADLRHGRGGGYQKVGFQLRGQTENRYWYTDFGKRYHRRKFQAKDGATEYDVASAAGVVKIHGCPNAVYVYELNRPEGMKVLLGENT